MQLTKDIDPQTHVARGATFIFIQGFLNAALGVLYVWFLLHTKEIVGETLFTEHDMGFFTILSFILTLTSTLGILALRSASVRFISHYLAKGEKDKAKSVMTRVIEISAITSLIIIILLLVLTETLSKIFASSALIFHLLAISSALTIFFSQTQGFLQGLQRMRELATIAIVYTIIHYSVSVILVFNGFGVLGIVISWLFALPISCLLNFLIISRHIKFSTSAHRLAPLLAFSFPLYISTLLTFFVGWVDQIFVFPFLGIGALGIYNLAVRASSVTNILSHSMITSLFPKLSELYSKFGLEGLKGAFKTSTRYAALLGFPISLMVATLAYPIIILFATIRFVDAVLPLAVMCIASIPTILGSAIFPMLYALERTRIASSVVIVSIVSEAVFAYISLAYLNMNLMGVAFSRVLASLTKFALGVYVLGRLLKVEFDKEAVWKSAAASLLMVASILVLELLRMTLEPSYQPLVLRIRQLPIYAAVGILVYFVSLIALKTFKKQDIDLLRNYLPSSLGWIATLLARITHLP